MKKSLLVSCLVVSFALTYILLNTGCSSSSSSKEDADSDGYCTKSDACKNTALLTGDCNDSDAAVNPAATEVAGDGVDNDCDGSTDEEEDSGSVNEEEDQSTDDDGDGYTEEQGDCDDTSSAISPAATETDGDGIDSNCDEQDNTTTDADGDGVISTEDCDDNDATVGSKTTYYADSDSDGYGNSDSTTQSCESSVSGYVTQGGDCDDTSSSNYPGAQEGYFYGNGGDHGDNIDNDCDEEVDEEVCSCDDLTGYKAPTSTSWLYNFSFIRQAHAVQSIQQQINAQITGVTKAYVVGSSGYCNAYIDTWKDLSGWDCDEDSTKDAEATPTTSANWSGFALWKGIEKFEFQDGTNQELHKVSSYFTNQEITDASSAGDVQFKWDARMEYEADPDEVRNTNYKIDYSLLAYNEQYMKARAASKTDTVCGNTEDSNYGDGGNGGCGGSVSNGKSIPLTEAEFPEIYQSGWERAVVLRGVNMRYTATTDPNDDAEMVDMTTSAWICEDNSTNASAKYHICWSSNMNGSSSTLEYKLDVRAHVLAYDPSYVDIDIDEWKHTTNSDYKCKVIGSTRYDCFNESYYRYWFGMDHDRSVNSDNGGDFAFDTGTGWTLTEETALVGMRAWGFDSDSGFQVNKVAGWVGKKDDYNGGVSGDKVYALMEGVAVGNKDSENWMSPQGIDSVIITCKTSDVCKRVYTGNLKSSCTSDNNYCDKTLEFKNGILTTN